MLVSRVTCCGSARNPAFFIIYYLRPHHHAFIIHGLLSWLLYHLGLASRPIPPLLIALCSKNIVMAHQAHARDAGESDKVK